MAIASTTVTVTCGTKPVPTCKVKVTPSLTNTGSTTNKLTFACSYTLSALTSGYYWQLGVVLQYKVTGDDSWSSKTLVTTSSSTWSQKTGSFNVSIANVTGSKKIYFRLVDASSTRSNGTESATASIYKLTAKVGSNVASVYGDIGYCLKGDSVSVGADLNSATGYTIAFNKWTSSNTSLLANSTKNPYSFSMPAGAITLTASATKTGYTYYVKYNANGGTGSMSNSTHVYGTSKALTANAFAKTGYTFQGWATSATGAVKYADKATVVNLTSTKGGTYNLYAVWKANTYTITYDANGGAGTMDSMSCTYDKSYTLTANAFARTGYYFAGWATSVDGSVSYTDQQSVSNLVSTGGGLITLYAVWTINSGTVYYYANGGSSTSSYTMDSSGKSSATSSFDYSSVDRNLYNVATIFARTGYHTESDAHAWRKDSPTSTTYLDQTSVDLSGYVTNETGVVLNLYANWAINTYYVDFYDNVENSTPISQSFTYGVSQALRANTFARSGYKFAGWNTSSNGNGTFYADSAKVSNLTATNGGRVKLYAQWQVDYYYIDLISDQTTERLSVPCNQDYTLPTSSFTKTGYKITSWNTSADGSGTSYATNATVNNLVAAGQVVSLYAQWTLITYSIKFNGNSSTSGTMSNMSMTYNTARNLTANAFTRTGYAFKGWSKNASGSVAYADKASVSNLTTVDGATVTLYAVWLKTTNVIYYYPNGGSAQATYPLDSSGKSSKESEFNTSSTAYDCMDVSELFYRPGYHVSKAAQAWRKDSATSTTYVSQESWNFAQYATDAGTTVKLYANWTANNYTVRYNANGGSGTMADASHTYNVSKALTANAFTRTGYRFTGWNTKANGTGTTYNNKQSVTNLTTVQNAVVTLYAQWTEISYTIHFNTNGATRGSVKDVTLKSSDSMVLDAVVHRYGEENLLSLEGISTKTTNGITFTVSASNGTVTANGTATSDTTFMLTPTFSSGNAPTLVSGFTHIVSAGVQTSNSTYFLRVQVGNSASDAVDANGYVNTSYTIDAVDYTRFTAFITVRNGVKLNNVVFKPIVALYAPYEFVNWYDETNKKYYNAGDVVSRLSTVDGATVTLTAQWQPKNIVHRYGSNLQTTACQIKYYDGTNWIDVFPYVYAGNTDGNLLSKIPDNVSVNTGGLRYYMKNGVIDIDGKATSDITIDLENYYFKQGVKYSLTGCPSGGSASTYKIIAVGDETNATDIGNGITYIPKASAYRMLQIIIKSGTTCSHLRFVPELRKGDLWTLMG